jgi:hypothetical protein
MAMESVANVPMKGEDKLRPYVPLGLIAVVDVFVTAHP